MKYYKLTGGTYPSYTIGKIYPEDSHGDRRGALNTAKDYASNREYWQEAEEKDYLLQVAKEKYPVGTEFISAHFKTKSIANNDFNYSEHSRNLDLSCSISCDGYHVYVKYKNGTEKWAEIISKAEIKDESMEKSIAKPYNDIRKDITYDMLLNHPYFRELSLKGLTDIINHVNYDKIYFILEGCGPEEKAEKLIKKWKESTEKKIIGYKLVKPEYKDAIEKIANFNNFDSFEDSYQEFKWCKSGADSLKEAGVLDLWFEPVYEEVPKFKKGDWVYIIDAAQSKDLIGKCSRVVNDSLNGKLANGFDYTSDNPKLSKYLRLATEGEILTHLTEEVKRRTDHKLPCRVKYLDNTGNNNLKGYSFEYNKENDRLSASGGDVDILYQNGKWAEFNVVPVITINGYTAKFNKDSVEFGCKTFYAEEIATLVDILGRSGLHIENQSAILEIDKYFKSLEK